MIDVNLLVYVGTLALFIAGVFVVGILTLVVFTAVATTVSIARARIRSRRDKYAYMAQDRLPTAIEFEQVAEPGGALLASQSIKFGHSLAAENIAPRRPSMPRLIQHV